MAYKQVLTIQDISCLGQCSLTVALPLLSVCGHETVVLPSSLLSNHTAFPEYTFKDLSDDMEEITQLWRTKGWSFDALYTGYLGSTQQIDFVRNVSTTLVKGSGKFIVDPAMADNGKLYPGFDVDFAHAMGDLAFSADIIVPNITEACLITGVPMPDTFTSFTKDFIATLCDALIDHGAENFVLTGVGFTEDSTGIVVRENGVLRSYQHERVGQGSHGTGDVYAAALVGSYIAGKSLYDAAVIAADYTVRCIRATVGDEKHWYGVKFEKEIPWLVHTLESDTPIDDSVGRDV